MIDWGAPLSDLAKLLLPAAISSILAPLFLLTIQAWIRKSRRPRLVIDTPSGRGWRVPDQAEIRDVSVVEKRLWLRVRVRNAGRTTARNCQVFMMQFGRPGASLLIDSAADFDPAPLIWAHTEHLEPSKRLSVDLPPGVHRFVDFVLVHGDGEPLYQLQSPTLVREFEDWIECHEGVSADLLVVDSDANSDRALLSFVTNSKQHKSQSWLEAVQWKSTLLRIRPR